jgi:hypothetical protein
MYWGGGDAISHVGLKLGQITEVPLYFFVDIFFVEKNICLSLLMSVDTVVVGVFYFHIATASALVSYMFNIHSYSIFTDR